jgi:hypothetical protein
MASRHVTASTGRTAANAQPGKLPVTRRNTTKQASRRPACASTEIDAMMGNASLWTLTFFSRPAFCTKMPTERPRRSPKSSHVMNPEVR